MPINTIPTNAMPNKIGVISVLQGQAVAVSDTGNEVPLSLHSPVFEGDLIKAIGADSKVIIETLTQQQLVLEGDTTLAMTAEMNAEGVAQVEQLQQAILDDENFDFSQLEASAAGIPESSRFLAPPVIEAASPSLGSTTFSNGRTFALASDANPVTDAGATNPSSSVPVAESAPRFLGDAQVSVTEDIQVSVAGAVEGQHVFTPGNLSTQFGALSYNERGEWRYTLANDSSAVQQLGAGDTLQESIELTANNGDRFVIEVTVNGTNDHPILTGDKVQSIYEDAFLSAVDKTVAVTGALQIQDVDAGEARFIQEQGINTAYGTAEVDAQGQWRYQLNNELAPVQGLQDGQTLNDAFSVNTVDGTRQTIQITIVGSNDKPILDGSNLVTLDLSASHEVQGRLLINDADFGQSHFQEQQVIAGRFGVGSMDEQGRWSYEVDADHPAIDSLGPEARLYDTFTIQTADNTQQDVIIEIRSGASEVATTNAVPLIELTNNDELLSYRASSVDDPSSNLYIWSASDETSDATALTDRIAHFEPGSGGDVLQLNDLLVDTQSDATRQDNNLEQFLHFSFDGQDTTIEIRPEGSSTQNSHFLILNNVDLTSYGNSDHEIIHQLISNGNLDIAGLG